MKNSICRLDVVLTHLGTAALVRKTYLFGGPRTTKAVFCATSPPGVSFAPAAVSTITAGNNASIVGGCAGHVRESAAAMVCMPGSWM